MPKKSKHVKAKAGTIGALSGVAGGVVSKVASDLLTDAGDAILERVRGHKAGKHKWEQRHDGKGGTGRGGVDATDPGLAVLKALAGHGARRVSRVLADAGAGVSPVLEALANARDFGLIRVDKNRVRLTHEGKEAAEALLGDETNRDDDDDEDDKTADALDA